MVRINNRKILNGVLEMIGLENQAERLAVLRVIDKFDKVGVQGVEDLLGSGRLDASGAYIDGVGYQKIKLRPLLHFLLQRVTQMKKHFEFTGRGWEFEYWSRGYIRIGYDGRISNCRRLYL